MYVSCRGVRVAGSRAGGRGVARAGARARGVVSGRGPRAACGRLPCSGFSCRVRCTAYAVPPHHSPRLEAVRAPWRLSAAVPVVAAASTGYRIVMMGKPPGPTTSSPYGFVILYFINYLIMR